MGFNYDMPCTMRSYQKFAVYAQRVSDACCDDGAPCVAGLPTSCSSGCAAVLFPMQADCAAYLLQIGVDDEIIATIAECTAAGSSGASGGH